MSMQDQNTVSYAAGWYPDTANPGTQRYYDGTTWTEHTSPMTATATIPSTAAAATAATFSPTKKKRKWPWIVGGAVAAIVLISTISANAGGGEKAELSDAPAAEAPAAEAVPEEAPAAEVAPPAASGTWANPMPQPYVAHGMLGGEKYSLSASVVNADAGAAVEEYNQFNESAPAGFKYVIVQMTMTGIDPDGVEPSLATFDLFLSTGEGNRYSNEFIVLADDMPDMFQGPTLYPGNAFTGFSVYVVPADATTFMLYDNSNYIAL